MYESQEQVEQDQNGKKELGEHTTFVFCNNKLFSEYDSMAVLDKYTGSLNRSLIKTVYRVIHIVIG